MTTKHLKLRIFASLLEVSVVCFLVYHTYSSSSSSATTTSIRYPDRRQGDVYRRTRVRQNDDEPNGRPNAMKRTVVSETDDQLMGNCPPGWPLEVLRPASARKPIAQVCRNGSGNRHWQCAPGWQRLKKDPFCIVTDEVKNKHVHGPNPVDLLQESDSLVNQPMGELSEETVRLIRTSARLKLLYVNIPHTGGSSIDGSFLVDNDTTNGAENKSFLIRNISRNPSSLKDYHMFTMVRHPCSRLIAAWEHYVQAYGNSNISDVDKRWIAENLDSSSMSSFDSFVRGKLSPGGSIQIQEELHLKPQVDIISSTFGRLGGYHNVLVFERWNYSMRELSKTVMTVQDGVLIQPWDSKAPRSCKDMYTQSSWAKMLHLYRMDFCVLNYSTAIDDAGSVPSIDKNGTVTSRIQQCNNILGTSKKLEREECVIHTYFQLPPNASKAQEKSIQTMVSMWKFAWLSAGWKPRILTEQDARNHSQYGTYIGKLMNLIPTRNLTEYETSSFMRHLAMSAVGGGWLSDYDVIPLRMPLCLRPLNNGLLTVYQLFVPSLMSGSGSEYLRAAEMITDPHWKDKLLQSSGHNSRVSDIQVFSHAVKEGAVIGMRTVIEARNLLEQPFDCERTWSSPTDYRYYTQTPNTLSPLPWAVHFSHASVNRWISANRTELWDGSPWNAKSLRQRGDVRPDLIRDAVQFLNSACSFNKNFH